MGRRQRSNDELDDEVRAGLDAAESTGITLDKLLALMAEAGFKVQSSYETVRKYRQGLRRLSDGDSERMQRYFAENEFGRLLADRASRKSNRLAKAHAHARDGRLMSKIGPGAAPKPERLTGSIRLASILIEGSQWGAGTVCTSFTVACPDWRRVAVARGRISMDPHPGRLMEPEMSDWRKAVMVASQAFGRVSQVILTREFSSAVDPFWEVVGMDGPIGRFTTAGDFAPLEGLSPGDRVTVTFGTWLGDMTGVGTAEEANEIASTDGLVVIDRATNEEPIEDPEGYKRYLISIIRGTALNAGEDGYVELSRCVLEIEKG